MEKTFAETVLLEGRKRGYLSALDIMEELYRHDAIEPGSKIDTRFIENGDILKANEWNVD